MTTGPPVKALSSSSRCATSCSSGTSGTYIGARSHRGVAGVAKTVKRLSPRSITPTVRDRTCRRSGAGCLVAPTVPEDDHPLSETKQGIGSHHAVMPARPRATQLAGVPPFGHLARAPPSEKQCTGPACSGGWKTLTLWNIMICIYRHELCYHCIYHELPQRCAGEWAREATGSCWTMTTHTRDWHRKALPPPRDVGGHREGASGEGGQGERAGLRVNGADGGAGRRGPRGSVERDRRGGARLDGAPLAPKQASRIRAASFGCASWHKADLAACMGLFCRLARG